MKYKKIKAALIVFTLIVGMNPIGYKNEIQAITKEKEIKYLFKNNNDAVNYKLNETKFDQYLIEGQKDISKNTKDSDDIFWVDVNSLVNSSKNISKTKKLIEIGYPVLFIKDNLTAKEIADILEIKTDIPEPQNVGNVLRQGIKIEKNDSEYLFTFVNVDANLKSNTNELKQSLITGSIETKVKDAHTNAKKVNSKVSMKTIKDRSSKQNEKLGLISMPTITATLPDTSQNWTYCNVTGSTEHFTDIDMVITAKSYKYDKNPIDGGQYLSMNIGEFNVSVKYTALKYLYTYISAPSGSTVTDYSPKNNSIMPSGFASLSLSIPISFSLPINFDVKTKFRLNGGGPGNGYVQLKSCEYSSVFGDYNVAPGDVLDVPQIVEYKNTTNKHYGTFTYSSIGTSYNHSGGFNLP